MTREQTPAEYIFNRLETRYQEARDAQAAGKISQDELERAAYMATEAAQILAHQKRWILPFFRK